MVKNPRRARGSALSHLMKKKYTGECVKRFPALLTKSKTFIAEPMKNSGAVLMILENAAAAISISPRNVVTWSRGLIGRRDLSSRINVKTCVVDTTFLIQ